MNRVDTLLGLGYTMEVLRWTDTTYNPAPISTCIRLYEGEQYSACREKQPCVVSAALPTFDESVDVLYQRLLDKLQKERAKVVAESNASLQDLYDKIKVLEEAHLKGKVDE